MASKRSIDRIAEDLSNSNKCARVEEFSLNSSDQPGDSPIPLLASRAESPTTSSDDQLRINSELINSATNLMMNSVIEENSANGDLVANTSNADLPNNSTSASNSVYRGLYPINDVKQYFKKIISGNQKVYICLWEGCNYQTKKYSQHISRHIYLQHIGIKELRCKEANCNKEFKRPESLVQHEKNHICGFGIDSNKMKDPNNICGVKNIKRYFTRIMDNDIYVYQCQFGNCQFATNNSGSIRRHIHNQHICPHSSHNGSAANANRRLQRLSATFADQTAGYPQYSYDQESIGTSNSGQQSDNEPNNIEPEVELNEYDNQGYDPVNRTTYYTEPRQIMPQDYSIHSNGSDQASDGQQDEDDLDVDSEEAASSFPEQSLVNRQKQQKNGIYSLKNYENYFEKVKTESGLVFRCKKCNYEAKTQITLIRHIWNETGYKDFQCDICGKKLENEFSRYRHRKFEHRISSPEPPPGSSPNHFVSPQAVAPESHLPSTEEERFEAAQPEPPQINDTSMNPLFPQQYMLNMLANNGAVQQETLQGLFENNMLYLRLNQPQLFEQKDTMQRFLVSYRFQCKLCAGFTADNKESIVEHLCRGHNVNLQNLDQAYQVIEVSHDSRSTTTTHSEDGRTAANLEVDQNDEFEMTQQMQAVPNYETEQQQQQQSQTVRRYNNRSKSGMYSLKKYPEFYKRTKEADGYHYKCTKCPDHDTRSQASMVRHIWTHVDQEFDCECGVKCENEFALYKHKKKEHPETTSPHNRSKNVQQQRQQEQQQQQMSNYMSELIRMKMEQQRQQQMQIHPMEINEESGEKEQEKTSRRSLQFKRYKYDQNENQPKHEPESDSDSLEEKLIVDEQNQATNDDDNGNDDKCATCNDNINSIDQLQLNNERQSATHYSQMHKTLQKQSVDTKC